MDAEKGLREAKDKGDELMMRHYEELLTFLDKVACHDTNMVQQCVQAAEELAYKIPKESE